jgi:hypothetical protein
MPELVLATRQLHHVMGHDLVMGVLRPRIIAFCADWLTPLRQSSTRVIRL